MKSVFYKSALAGLLAALFAGCSPQAVYFDVDVQNIRGTEVDLQDKTVGVFSVVPSAVYDSTLVANAALGVAAKLEKDRGMGKNDVDVFSIPAHEYYGFSAHRERDVEYLTDLMLRSGADLQIFISDVKYGRYKVQTAYDYEGGYSQKAVFFPCFAKMDVYDALNDSLLLSRSYSDTIYMSVMNTTSRGDNYAPVIAKEIKGISQRVGESLAENLTRQWYTQQRLLVNYPDDGDWNTPCMLALRFQWKEAIEKWMPLTQHQQPKKAAFAAYNIALACEMLEEFPLAMEWIRFSVSKYRFAENVELQQHLLKLVKNRSLKNI